MKAPRPQPTLLGPVAGIFGRAYYFEEAGQFLHAHTHQYPHAVFVQQGRIRIDRDGVPEEAGPGRLLLMPAAAMHQITAIEPDTISICWFVVPDGATDLRPYTE